METKFNFKSQICTSRSQSERLLALGLKKETADMVLCEPFDYEKRKYSDGYVKIVLEEGEDFCKDDIPAWSLHRLIEMATTENIQISFYKNQVKVWGRICREEFEASYYDKPNVFDNFICGIAWLIKEGYFNKEYLI